MTTLEIIGYKRANLGKQDSKSLRSKALVPGVLYGGTEQLHFSTPMAVLKELVYTPKAHFVTFNLEGSMYNCILQDIQFHPVSEIILHIDFLQIFERKQIKMHIPITLTGFAPGVAQGGKLVIKQKKLLICAYPNDMPDEIKVDISALGVGEMARVSDIKLEACHILAVEGTPVVAVETTRALRTEVTDSKTGKK